MKVGSKIGEPVFKGSMSALLKREKGDSTKSSASSSMFYNILLFINFKETTEAIGGFKT
jgi:hypothetical protein